MSDLQHSVSEAIDIHKRAGDEFFHDEALDILDKMRALTMALSGVTREGHDPLPEQMVVLHHLSLDLEVRMEELCARIVTPETIEPVVPACTEFLTVQA